MASVIQSIHNTVFGLLGDTSLDFALQVSGDFFAHLGNTVIDAKFLGEFIVNFRQLGYFNLGKFDFEFNGLTGKLFNIVSRERHFKGLLFTGLHSGHTLFKVREHLTGADHKSETVGRTAFKRRAVELTNKVNRHALFFSGNTVFFHFIGGTLLTHDFERLFNFGVSDFADETLEFHVLQIRHFNFRENFNRSRKFRIFTVLDFALRGDFRSTGNLQTGFLNSLFISLADQVIHSVHVGLSTVHFADHLHRNLTRAETVSLSRLSTTLKDRFGVGLQLLSRNRQIKGTFQRTLRGFFFSHFLLLIKVFGMNKVTSNGSIVREPSPRPIKNLSSVRSILLFAQKRLIIATVATKL